MKNVDASRAFVLLNGTRIEELFWVAGSIGHPGLEDFLATIPSEEMRFVFPDIYNSRNYATWCMRRWLSTALAEFGKYGFVARLSHPWCADFRFREGSTTPVSWVISKETSVVAWAYAETVEGLMAEIEKSSRTAFMNFLEDHKSRNMVPRNIKLNR